MSTYLPKIMITGSSGQLGCALRHHPFAQAFEINSYSHANLDITHMQKLEEVIGQVKPEMIINAAAYTAVDQAEHDREAAMRVNYFGPLNLAKLCKKWQIFLVHISTDYIFDGSKQNPYDEQDEVNPLNVYGESKWLGEQALREYAQRYCILRVSGIFSEYQNNFVKTIMKLAQKNKELRIVADQITCPTYAGHIASAIFSILKAQIGSNGDFQKTYHYCSAHPVSWFEFASCIMDEFKKQKSLSQIQFTAESVKPISSLEYKTAAKRPTYSVLNCCQIKRDFGIEQPSWKNVLKELCHMRELYL